MKQNLLIYYFITSLFILLMIMSIFGYIVIQPTTNNQKTIERKETSQQLHSNKFSLNALSVTITSSRPTTDVGQSVNFIVTGITGGVSPYTYVWSGLPTGCSSQNIPNLPCTPTGTGTFFVTVYVEDSTFLVPQTGTSNQITHMVSSQPSLTPVSANPVSGRVDVGQSVTFSTTGNGGRLPYTYNWIGLPSGCSSTSSPSINCSPAAAGTFSVSVRLIDANSYQVSTSPLSFTVHPAPTVSTPVANPPIIDLTQTTMLSVSVNGGLGPYSYLWNGLPTGCNSLNTNQISCTPTITGPFSITVRITDFNGFIVTSLPRSLTVHTDPVIGTPTASIPSGGIDVGQTVVFSSAPSGGTPPYTYTWTGLPPGCTNSGTSNVNCTPTGNGTFNITIKVTDATGFSVTSNSLNYTILSKPFVSIPLASIPSGNIDVGQNVTFTSITPTGGLAPYSYSWSGLPTGCSDSGLSFVDCTPSNSGTFSVVVTITDSNGYQVLSSPLSFIVLDQPSIDSFTSTRSTIDLTQNLTFSVTVSGGASPYSFLWTLPSGCNSINSSSITCIPTLTGLYTTNVTVTDSNGFTITSSDIALTVYDDPVIGVPTASPISGDIDVGQSVIFTSAIPSLGLAPYDYSWLGLPDGCSDSGSSTNLCTPTTAGLFNITVTIVDANGYSIQSEILNYLVESLPTVTPPSPSSPTGIVGDTVIFNVIGSSGSGSLTYEWETSDSNLNCNPSSTDTISCVPLSAGSYTITITVTDSNGGSATATSDIFLVNTGPITSSNSNPTSTSSLSSSSPSSSNDSTSSSSNSKTSISITSTPGFMSLISSLAILMSAGIIIIKRRYKKV